MSSKENLNDDMVSDGSSAAVDEEYAIENKSKPRKFKSSIFGSASVFALACITIWTLRVPIGQAAFQSILKAKGIDANLELKSLRLNAAAFDTLKIGQAGQETIIAHNGVLRWSFSPFDGFLNIEEIKAESLNAHFAIKNGNFDYRALSPLFGGGGGGKTKIENINLPKANFIIDSEYGSFGANLKINGNLENLFALGDIILPQNIQRQTNNPIGLSFFGKNLNKRSKSYGVRLGLAQNNLDLSQFTPNLKVFGASGDVDIGLTENGGDKLFIIRSANLKAQEVTRNDTQFSGLNIDIKPSTFSFSKDWSNSALFDLNFNIKSSQANIIDQQITGLVWAFDIDRGADKKIDIAISANNNSLNGAFDAKNLDFKLDGQINSPNLKEISAANFVSQLQIKANHLYFNQEIKNQFASMNAQDLGAGGKLDVNLALAGDMNEFSVKMQGMQWLAGNNGSLLEILPSQIDQENIVNFAKIDDAWHNSGKISPVINLRNRLGGSVNIKVKEFSFNNRNAKLILDNIMMRNFQYEDYNLNTNGAAARFIIENNNIRQGQIIGDFVLRSDGEVKIVPSLAKIDAQFINNNANFTIESKIPRAIFNKNLVENANLKISGIAVLPNGIKSRPININSNLYGNISHLKMGDDTDARDFTLSGPVRIRLDDDIDILGQECLHMRLASLKIDDNQISSANGNICPDETGRFAIISNGKTQAYAQTNFSQLDLKMGNDESANHIVLSGLSGRFIPNSTGILNYVASAPNLSFTFATGPQSNATISAKNSEISIANENGITSFNAKLFDITSTGLGVETSGDILLNFNFGQDDTQGSFTFRDLLVKDGAPAKRFADLRITGSGNLRDNKIYIEGRAAQSPKNIDIAFIRLNHNLRNGIGNIVFDASDLRFVPSYVRRSDERAFDIDDIIPALKGILVDVDGNVKANARIDWQPDTPIKSIGEVHSTSINFDTLLGPVTNLSGDIRIDDLFKMKTSSTQEIKVGSFNPGLPILNGVFGFNLTGDNSLKIESAQWPFADGILSIDPTIWQFNNSNKILTIKVDNIDLAQFLRLTNVPNLEIDGRMSGVLPVHIVENDVQIIGGKLRAREGGGTLRYTGPSFNAPPRKARGLERLRQSLFGKPPAQGAVLAENALRDLDYKILELRVDGRITGDMTIGATILGSNDEVLNAAPFLFNVNMSLPIGQIQNAIKNALDTCATLNGEQIEGLEDVCPNNVTRTNSGAPN